MRELRPPAPATQSAAASAASSGIDVEAMWNQLLLGQYGSLIPAFRNDRQNRDLLELQKYIPQVIEFLEAWENVPQNLQPPWYRAALADYHIVARLQWIFFEHGNPKEWISPLPDAGTQVIFTEPTATDTNVPYQPGPTYARPVQTQQPQNAVPNYAQPVQTQPQQDAAPNYSQQVQSSQSASGEMPNATASPAWQSYQQNSLQQTEQSEDPAASAWKHSSQPSWQMNSGTQQWGSQAQSSNWQGSSYQGSNARQPYWKSSQYTSSGQYQRNPQQGRSSYEALMDGNFPKASFTPGKQRRLKPRAHEPHQCPDPEFEVKFIEEAMTHMYSYNSGDLPSWTYDVMYSPWLPPSLAIEKMSGMRNPMLYQYVNHDALCFDVLHAQPSELDKRVQHASSGLE
eukprot:4664612-Amphidinium_carterae.2